MAISVGDALLHLGVDSSELDAGMNRAVSNIKNQMKIAGAALTAFGAATVGALTMATKSALDEEIGIQRLSNTLKNVGVAYADVRKELEASIATLQKKTSYGDEEQRDALNDLINLTGDYNDSLKLLQISMDMATAKQIDLSSAAMLVGRAVIGDTSLLKRYGIVVREGADAAEILATMQEKFGGAAEAAANPITQLQNLLGDLMQDIGKGLIPVLRSVVELLTPIIENIRTWIEEHPKLAQAITIATAVVGGLSLALGSLLLILPLITAAVGTLGVTASIALGGIPLLVGAIVTAGFFLWQNWDKVVAFFKKAWANIKIFFLEGIESVLDSLSKFTKWIPGLGEKIDQLHDKIANMIEAEKLKKDLIDVEQEIKQTTAAIEETTAATEAATVVTDNSTTATHKTTAAIIAEQAALEKQKEELEDYQKKLEEFVSVRESLIESIEKTREEFEYERSEAGKLGITVKDVIFTLIDMGWTDKMLTDTLYRLGDEADNVNAVLKAVGLTAAEVAAKLDTQKESVEALSDSYSRYDEVMKAVGVQGGMVDKSGQPTPEFEEWAANISNKDFQASEEAQRVRDELAEFERASLSGELPEDATISPISMWVSAMQAWANRTGWRIAGYAHGGLITEPTLLSRLSDMKPYAIAGEAGPERVSPISPSVNVLITKNNFNIRNDSDIERIAEALVDRIRLKTGVRV